MENAESQDKNGEHEGKKAGETDVYLQNCQFAKLSSMLLDVLDEVLHSQADRCHHLDKLDDKVDEVPSFVPFTDTISDPGAMMIESCDA